MEYNKSLKDNSLVVILSGAFTIGDSDHFLRILDNIDRSTIHTVQLDFSRLSLIDSSALGLLLLLKHEVSKRGMHTKLTNVTGQVWKTINITQFDKLFEIA